MPESHPDQPTRRSVLTGAGLAMAGGAAAAVLPTDVAAADPAGVAHPGAGGTAVEFRGRITQSGSSGQDFAALGILTALAGAPRSALFDGAATTIGSALFTITAEGSLVARVLDRSVHALDIAGTLAVFQRRHGGADFDRPRSFSEGTCVARFELALQDVLTVFATARGLPTLTGDMRQTTAGPLAGRLAGRRFGVAGQRLRMLATGLGELVDPVTLNAQLEVAGNWSVE
jgi:hypothetical protein